MPPASATKPLILAKTLLTRSTTSIEQRKLELNTPLTSAASQLRRQRPLQSPVGPICETLSRSRTSSFSSSPSSPSSFTSHSSLSSQSSFSSHGSTSSLRANAWPLSPYHSLPASVRLHGNLSALGRHHGTTSSAQHHHHYHTYSYQPSQAYTYHPVSQHRYSVLTQPSIANLTRFALVTREFVGKNVAPEIRRLGVGLYSQCGTPLCRHVRTIFSEKGGFSYW